MKPIAFIRHTHTHTHTEREAVSADNQNDVEVPKYNRQYNDKRLFY